MAFPSAAEVGARDSQTAQLQAALARLETREDAEHARGALEQARRALGTASTKGKDEAAVERAQGIARAAITLATRQLDRRRAQADLVDAERRLQAIRARADAQRRALEALMRERAALARRMEAR